MSLIFKVLHNTPMWNQSTPKVVSKLASGLFLQQFHGSALTSKPFYIPETCTSASQIPNKATKALLSYFHTGFSCDAINFTSHVLTQKYRFWYKASAIDTSFLWYTFCLLWSDEPLGAGWFSSSHLCRIPRRTADRLPLEDHFYIPNPTIDQPPSEVLADYPVQVLH